MENNFAKNLFYCTSLVITDKKGKPYHGRTMEFSTDQIPSAISYYPKGTFFQSISPDGSKAHAYTAAYEILGIGIPMAENGEGLTYELCEGFNSAGLSFSLNMMPNSELPEIQPSAYSNSIPFDTLGHWALAVCVTVEEIKEKIKHLALWSRAIAQIGGIVSPFHFAFYDKHGGSIVVEVSAKTLHIYDNPTKVMTNGPEFSWHLTNLHNYTHLTNQDVSVNTLGNLKLRQPDCGIATVSLPASDTSVDRFIRAVFYATFANQVEEPEDAILELSHIMNKFDRPKNMTLTQQGEGGEVNGAGLVSEFTVWTSLSDLTRGILYVRSYKQLNYLTYSLAQFKEETKPVHFLV